MPKELALILCVCFILWLFVRDGRLRPMNSWALWVPLLWVLIIGSKPVSEWLGNGAKTGVPVDYLEGSPLDRNVYLALIVAGLLVLLRRRVNWAGVFASNSWVFLFFAYCGVSIIWSDYPFVSLKRWTKDAGNLVMILIILTEADPVGALRAVFARYTYAALPLSVLLIKYFPDTGRYYNLIDQSTWEPAYRGVATGKNGLGCIVFICGLFLIWDFFEPHAAGARRPGLADKASRALLMFLVVLLIATTHSATSTVCLLLGAVMLIALRVPVARRQVRYLGTYSVILGLLVFVFYSVPGIVESSVQMLGRNMTLTGRTGIWTDVLSVPIDSFIGTGYQSFWLGPRVEPLWDKYPFHPIQAHNGYLEVYLNGGLLGLCMLMAMVISTGGKLKRALLAGNSEAALLFSFFITILFYNWTEAAFYGLNLVWFALLVAALSYPGMASGRALAKG